jgi:sugar-specific transcriptional regulator TrmB
MIKEILKELGFSDYEINIYLTLVELGESTPSKVAEKARIHRRNVYDALNRLVKKGFVSLIIKNNRKYYSAVNPNRIKSMFKEKIELIDTLLPPLKLKFKESQVEQEVKLLEGREGIKSFFEDMYEEAKRGAEFYIIGAPATLPKMLPYYIPKLVKRAAKFKVKVHVLWSPDVKQEDKNFLDVVKPKSRTLPKGFYLAMPIFIYGEKSAIAVWSEKPIITIIKSKGARKGFENYFKLLWKVSK